MQIHQSDCNKRSGSKWVWAERLKRGASEEEVQRSGCSAGLGFENFCFNDVISS
jgi:hypothetical protein